MNNELFKTYFTGYQSLRNMYKKLSGIEGVVNGVWVESVSKLKRIIEYAPKDDFNIEENEKTKDIVERILYFNQLNQAGKGLKI